MKEEKEAEKKQEEDLRICEACKNSWARFATHHYGDIWLCDHCDPRFSQK